MPLISYDNAGRILDVIDPMGCVTENTYDVAGRKTQTVEDSGSGLLNRTTQWTHTLDNLVETMTAVNATTGDQTTTYAYGTTLSTDGVARNDLLDKIKGSKGVSVGGHRNYERPAIKSKRPFDF